MAENQNENHEKYGDQQFTDGELDTIKGGAFGAIALVSKAEPGFFAPFKESMAGAKALAQAPAQLQGILREGGMVLPPSGDAQAVEKRVLEQLGAAVALLKAKDSALADSFRNVVLEACDAVAEAAKGVSPEETAMVDRIKGALV